MIYYDSHKWTTLLQLNGSVFPMATLLAVPSCLAAFILRYLVVSEVIRIELFDTFSNNNSVYSGFTFVLGFSLVFRTSESYHRFWTAATSCHEMGSEWSDCCSSLIAFVQTSKHPQEAIQKFTHRVVRLFCLLHAMAMEEIADLQEGNFPLIDIEGFNQKDLATLLNDECHGKRVQVVLCWIKLLIIQAHDSGLLSVPPPILTRVFQELGLGLVEYHKAQQVVIWPFPFPYTQMNLVLIYVYMAVTPLVIVTWDMEPWLAALCTFLSVLCMVGLDLIASELENPFGEDANDLPVRQIHGQMIRVLLLQLNPKTWKVPRLLPTAILNFPDLVGQKMEHRLSLMQSSAAGGFRAQFSARRPSTKTARKNLKGQLEWAAALSLSPEKSRERLQQWLRVKFSPSNNPEDSANGEDEDGDDDELQRDEQMYLSGEVSSTVSQARLSPSSSRLYLTASENSRHGHGSGSRLGDLMEPSTSKHSVTTTPPLPTRLSSDFNQTLQHHLQEQAALFAQMHANQLNTLRLLGGGTGTETEEDGTPHLRRAQSASAFLMPFPDSPLGHRASHDRYDKEYHVHVLDTSRLSGVEDVNGLGKPRVSTILEEMSMTLSESPTPTQSGDNVITSDMSSAAMSSAASKASKNSRKSWKQVSTV